MINWKEQIFNVITMFIGVYAAFALTNWQNDKELIQLEYVCLMDIKGDLQDDEVIIQDQIEKLTKAISCNKSMSDAVQSKQLVSMSDSLIACMPSLLYDFNFFPVTTGFEKLRDNDVYISDNHLHKGLIDLYEHKYQKILKTITLDQDNTNLNIMKHLMEYTSINLNDSTNLTSDINYNLESQYFVNALALQRYRRQRLIEEYTMVKSLIQKLMYHVDENLGKIKSQD